MKKFIFTLTVLLFTVNIFGQKNEISMSAILKNAGTMVDLVEREYGQEIVRMEFDIIQTSKQTFRTLTDSYEYGILAFGDFRIKDIDIKVYKWTNNQWILIKQDDNAESGAMVTVKPAFTAEYKIVITAYSFNSGYNIGHYGLIIFHE
jgi:hypothetical protein